MKFRIYWCNEESEIIEGDGLVDAFNKAGYNAKDDIDKISHFHQFVLATVCVKCEKDFELTFDTVILSHEDQPPHGMIPVIKCPNCGKRYEF